MESKKKTPQLYLYRDKKSQQLHCSAHVPSSADTNMIFPVRSKQQVNRCFKFLDYTIFVSQPDLFVINARRLKDASYDTLMDYTNQIMVKTREAICRDIFKGSCQFPFTSNIMCSSILFNFLTGQKLIYTKLLIKHGLAPPNTVVQFNDGKDQGTLWQLAETIFDKNVVVKYPFASSSSCIVYSEKVRNFFSHNRKLSGKSNEDKYLYYLYKEYKNCIGDLLGWIVQPELRFVHEIRFVMIMGEPVLCFMLGQSSNYFFPFVKDIPEQIDKDVFTQMKKSAKKVFRLINRSFSLNESFMRIDFFLMDDGRFYVNEIEPFASGRVAMALRSNAVISDGIRSLIDTFIHKEHIYKLVLIYYEYIIRKTIVDLRRSNGDVWETYEENFRFVYEYMKERDFIHSPPNDIYIFGHQVDTQEIIDSVRQMFVI